MEVAGRAGSRFLHDRRLARSPLWFYRHGLGWLLGQRLLMLEHLGRSSGQVREVCLEVVDRPTPASYRVVSGLGPRSQWFRNLQADPRCRVSTGRLRHAAATARRLPQEQVAAVLADYAARHPRGWQVLERTMRQHLPAGRTYGEFLPVVDLVLEQPTDGAGAHRR
ncbi:nitroreductase family deazaflavin-dependent oxidoreductase [Ornithinimicrobium avium]|uniref:Nitroreductase family deazaflavin-dependent oxidoreductase n=1 Tax=Ornithinimicrobium avium TaxID=2283195 RepID=A0A345NS14_9MICO|nr:nitroreductase family deazaflavin-dependent oxidoreductase [Ornithinimicrobium avium]